MLIVRVGIAYPLLKKNLLMNFKVFNVPLGMELRSHDKKPILEWLAPTVSGIGDAISNFFSNRETNRTNRSIAESTNQANLELYREQYQNSIEQWKRENAYNDPSAQLSRLRAAGLNPSLSIGNNAAGTAQAASLPSANPYVTGAPMQAPEFNFSDIAGNIASMAAASKDTQTAKQIGIDNLTRNAYNKAEVEKSMQQLKNLVSSQKLTDTQERLAGKEFDRLALDYKLLSETYDSRKESFELQNLMTKAQTEVLDEQARVFEADKAFKEAQTELTREQVKHYGAQIKASIDALYSQMAVNKSTIDLNSKEGELKLANKFESEMRARGVKLDNASKRKLLPYVVAGAKSEIKFRNSQRSKNYAEGAASLINAGSNAAANIWRSATGVIGKSK